MSRVDKLSILGVRSFDNQTASTIQFFSPLTLIVGYNGSGKTTIIECLKYATTGELPPNSKGGAFIHDPKLCGEKEVLAQIKMSFYSTSQVRMVATRNLQLTVKKTTRSQKTLEGQLLMVKDGERTSVSSRVAELDQILPQYLGVSAAILESVIFCHQDDSLWPMSEPSVLKKRFDEIFEALKYTKAIDNIKILRKKQMEELGKFKIVEQHAKEDKDKGERAKQRSEELYDEIEVLRAKSVDLGEKVKEAGQKMNQAWEHRAKFDHIVGDLRSKRIESQTLKRTVEDLRQHIKEMTDTDDELRSHLAKYDERVVAYEQDDENQRTRYAELVGSLDENRHILGVKQAEVGKLEAQKEQYERQVERRESLVKDTARRHNIRGFDYEISEDHIKDFMDRLRRLTRDQKAALERVRREHRESEQEAQTEINSLNERRSALSQSKQGAKAQIAGNDHRIMKHQSESDKINVDEGGTAILESKLDDVGRKLSKAKAEAASSNWDADIEGINSRARILEDKKEQLDTELIEGTRQAGDSARLDFLRKELRDRQHSLETLTGAHKDRLEEHLGRTYDPSSLEEDYQAAVDHKSKELREAELQRDGTSREIEQVQFKLTQARASLKRKREEMKQHETDIREAIDGADPEEFDEKLAEAVEEYESISTDAGKNETTAEYYRVCLSHLREHNECRTCRRSYQGLSNETGVSSKTSFMQRLEKMIADKMKDAADAGAQELKEYLDSLREIKPTHENWRRLKGEEIPQLEQERKELESRQESLNRRAEDQDEAVRGFQEAKRNVEMMSKPVQSIQGDVTEIEGFKKQITELSGRQSSAGLSRGLEQIQDDLKHVNEESKECRTRLAQLTGERDRARSQISSLELELRDVQSKISSANYQLKEKSNLDSQIRDLKAQNSEQREAMRKVDEDLRALTPLVDQAQAKYTEVRRRNNEREAEVQQDEARLSDSLRYLSEAERDIADYETGGGRAKLDRTQREIQSLGKEVSSIETEQQQVVKDIKRIEEQLRNHSETRRGISENLRFREKVRELGVVDSEIMQLESHNAEADKERYEREGSRWQMERNKLSAEQASTIGSLKSKDDQLKELLENWELDYKDAPYKYREAHVKVETTKAAVEDLARYGGALDKAIMKYHSLKMEEINRIIEELWKRTYQGTDVDNIMIRSDNENLKGNKSYNYRVVMVKQDAEMDMRGRCSAGQRVLASIIIRLALAECFGVNCGLIALDEPTTNLDRDNIRALAEALAEIIRVRRQQSNFQLIVITHDEEFLRYMQCADFCDYYYRVSRNDRQKSIIEKQSIAAVS